MGDKDELKREDYEKRGSIESVMLPQNVNRESIWNNGKEISAETSIIVSL